MHPLVPGSSQAQNLHWEEATWKKPEEGKDRHGTFGAGSAWKGLEEARHKTHLEEARHKTWMVGSP
jgi:hypothetical protein